MSKLWGLKDKKILIVDDFPAMRSMMRSMLVAYGANNIAEARNGDEALEHLASETREIVLCDYNLGDNSKDGQQILEEAKQRELLPYSSIFIMCTAENTSEMVMGAVEHMPDDYLVKPFTKVILQARLRKVEEKKLALKRISDAIESKNYQRALALCDAHMHDNQKLIFELMKLKGELLLKVADYAAAVELYKKVMGIREVLWAQFGMGKAYFFQRELDEARDQFEAVISQNKSYVAAYDWLARVQQAMGDNAKAQQTLVKAVTISPKALLRQRALAEVSLEIEEYDTAEKAFKNTIREGKNSIYKSPNDYGGLAKVHVKKNANDAAVKAIASMKQEFRRGDADAQLLTAVVESVVYKDMGRNDDSSQALDKAMALFEENPGSLTSKAAMELAEACYSLEKKEQGSELMKHVVRNHHEDEAVLAKAQKMFDDLGMAAEGDQLINGTRKEVVDVNNNGVDLAKQGKLKESINLFAKAARAMPENLVINLNAAQSLIMLMQDQGANSLHMDEAHGYLERVKHINAGNERYKNLLLRFNELARSAG
jgi:CheY-like chemotaxis protein